MIKGLDMLRWDDQQDLRKKGGFTTTGAAVPAADRESASSDDEDDVLKTEYAKSSQSSCRKCNQKIQKGEVRIGKEVPEGPYTSVYWHHLACYKVPKSLTEPSGIDGYSKLKGADKQAVQDHIADAQKARKTKSKKRKATDAPAEAAPDPKRAKIEADMKARAEKLWKIIDKLKNKYTNDEFKAILKYNEQSTYGGPQEVLMRVADGELAGALPLCSECENGHLNYEDGKIKCHGNISAWSKCTFETTDLESVARKKWKYPKNADLPDLVADLKEEKAAAKQSAYAPPPVVSTSSVFQDLVFTIIGSVDDKADVEFKVENHGGEIVGSVSKKCTHIISTYEEVTKKKKTAKLTNALKSGLPVVDPIFLDHALSKNNLDDIEKFLVWKDGSAVEVDEKLRDSVVPFSGIPKKKRMAIPPVDPQSELAETGSILVDNDEVFGVMLNVTDLSVGQSGRNSFYVLQIIKANTKAAKFNVFRRWGRVGQDGDSKEETFKNKDAAIDEFKTVFLDKTKNHWETFVHGQFQKAPGKFAPVELDDGAEDSASEADEKSKVKKVVVPADGKKVVINERVQKLVKLLFDTGLSYDDAVFFLLGLPASSPSDMILGVMKNMDIDIEKMPLGKLSKKQIKAGERLLELVEAELEKTKADPKANVAAKLFDLSNQFYTTIPQDFGNAKPPTLNTWELLQQKYDLLAALQDIEVAARMIEGGDAAGGSPMEQKYHMLKNDIGVVERGSEEWKRLETYMNNTREDWNLKIIDIFKIDRHEERELFAKHDHLDNRRLLWHGSNVAVFAAILSGGLKIMPHSGGRVGRGCTFWPQRRGLLRFLVFVCHSVLCGYDCQVCWVLRIARKDRHGSPKRGSHGYH